MIRVLNRNKKLIKVYRSASGSFVRGKWVPGDDKPVLTTRAQILPSAGKDLLNLAEGQRTKETVTIYSDITLYTADETANKVADIIGINGKLYTVSHTRSYDTSFLSHTKALCVRKDK